jgi:hypothetical protein
VNDLSTHAVIEPDDTIPTKIAQAAPCHRPVACLSAYAYATFAFIETRFPKTKIQAPGRGGALASGRGAFNEDYVSPTLAFPGVGRDGYAFAGAGDIGSGLASRWLWLSHRIFQAGAHR